MSPMIIFFSAFLGCSSAPPCPVTPVHIEETREDVKMMERDLAAARDRADKLKAELDEKKSELDSKKDKPGELRKKLEELKKGSGRGSTKDEKKDKDEDKEEGEGEGK